jgi:hypothetical protein
LPQKRYGLLRFARNDEKTHEKGGHSAAVSAS